MDFDAANDIFAENAWYFRNALVRANYNNLKEGIHETTEYLELFLRNFVLDEKNELQNRTMHIRSNLNNNGKADIEEKMRAYMPEISEKILRHIFALYDECGKEKVSGRSFVEEITG